MVLFGFSVPLWYTLSVMVPFLKVIIVFVLHGFLASEIVNTFLNMSSNGIGKTLLLVGFYTIFAVGIFFLVTRLGNRS